MNMITRQEKLGIAFADVIIETAHQTYNAHRGRKIILACIKQLEARFDEIQEKKATPKYKKARYGQAHPPAPQKPEDDLKCGCDGYYQTFGVHRPGCPDAF